MKAITLKAALAVGALAIAGTFASTSPALARGNWCAVAGGSAQYSNCGYYTFRQCLAAVRGVGGTCQPNPNVRTYVVEDDNGVRIYRRYYR
jgi:hypothetical protein